MQVQRRGRAMVSLRATWECARRQGRSARARCRGVAAVWAVLTMVEDLLSRCAAWHARARLAASQHDVAGLLDGQSADAHGSHRAA